jgi:hypothetical protein
MGVTHDVSGSLATSYKLPTAVWFKGPGEFELLGHRKSPDFDNVASGVKQSLDSNLCRQHGQGERFMVLCKKHKVDKESVIHELLQTTLNKISAHLQAKDAKARCNMTRVNITVPVMWTIDKHGKEIQEEIEKLAVGAGFPAEKIDFDTEPGSAMTFLAHKYGSSRRRRVCSKTNQLTGELKAESVF